MNLDEVLSEFVVHRKKLRKPLTEYGLKLIKNRLNKLAETEEEQIEILNQSIMEGWQGVFALKEDGVSNNVKVILAQKAYEENKKKAEDEAIIEELTRKKLK